MNHLRVYGPAFARVYDTHYTFFAEQIAPKIQEFYETQPISSREKSILDIGCGTGYLARHFLDAGYSVTGIDLSDNMLAYARQNAGHYLDEGLAQFIEADVRHLALNEQFGLIVATFEVLHHMRNEANLRQCFEAVFPHLIEGGFFIFDLCTQRGHRLRDKTDFTEEDDAVIVYRGVYDEAERLAVMKFSGFVRVQNGYYERFEETIINTTFDLDRVKELLHQVGWRNVHVAAFADLAAPVADPASLNRVYVVAEK